MDDFMALEILKILKKGESNGYHTVKKDILDMESFSDKTETDFQTTFTKLHELNHISAYRDESTNYMEAFRISNSKDYILIYQKRLNEKLNSDNAIKENTALSLQINKLNLDKLQYETTIRDLQRSLAEAQLKEIPKIAADRKTVITWQIIAGVLALVAFLLKLFGVQGWL